MLDFGSVLPPAVVVAAGRVEVVVLGILFHHLHISTPPHTSTVMITTRAMTPPVTPPAIAATDANTYVCVCVCVCLHMFVCVCVCVCVCVHVMCACTLFCEQCMGACA